MYVWKDILIFIHISIRFLLIQTKVKTRQFKNVCSALLPIQFLHNLHHRKLALFHFPSPSSSFASTFSFVYNIIFLLILFFLNETIGFLIDEDHKDQKVKKRNRFVT